MSGSQDHKAVGSQGGVLDFQSFFAKVFRDEADAAWCPYPVNRYRGSMAHSGSSPLLYTGDGNIRLGCLEGQETSTVNPFGQLNCPLPGMILWVRFDRVPKETQGPDHLVYCHTLAKEIPRQALAPSSTP